MMNITLTHIVAHDKNFAIGLNNSLPWNIPTDMKHFRETTKNAIVIMGRKTYESIGKPLPNRLNIIVSRSNDFIASGAITSNDINKAIEMAESFAQQRWISEIFIIGGAEIYKATQHKIDKIIATLVHTELPNADAYYPDYSNLFNLVSENNHSDADSNTDITIKTLFKTTA